MLCPYGMVTGEVEVAWPESRLAILGDDRADRIPAVEEAGWKAWTFDVSAETVWVTMRKHNASGR